MMITLILQQGIPLEVLHVPEKIYFASQNILMLLKIPQSSLTVSAVCIELIFHKNEQTQKFMHIFIFHTKSLCSAIDLLLLFPFLGFLARLYNKIPLF